MSIVFNESFNCNLSEKIRNYSHSVKTIHKKAITVQKMAEKAKIIWIGLSPKKKNELNPFKIKQEK